MREGQFYGSTDGQSRTQDGCDAGPSSSPRVCREDYLRRKLKYFFMNPCEKWRAKKKMPWKLVLQIIKIGLVTIQLWMFGLSRSSHIDFLEKSAISFRHLFLKDWTSGLETMPYPPSSGDFAIYTIKEFYDSVGYALQRYEETEKIAMGTYRFHRPDNSSKLPPMELCNSHFMLAPDWIKNQSYKFNTHQRTDCYNLTSMQILNNVTNEEEKSYDIGEIINSNNWSINFDSVNMIRLNFHLSAIHLKYLSRIRSPDCYIFHISIIYDNQEHDGQMKIDLVNKEEAVPCYGEMHYEAPTEPKANNNDTPFSTVLFSTIFDVVVVLISFMSFLLCLRSIVKGLRLEKQTVELFRKKYNKELDLSDKLEFLNMWYVLIIVNDLMTIAGSGFKIAIENRKSQDYETCGILLGTGSLLVWFGVLRYLGFFEKYNVLILTMKKSAPNVLRFLVCAAVFYFGFTICGWVVLGPYHIKFRRLSSASECLFSLVNGDDMFVTFAAIKNSKNGYIWWYSRIYLYIFISLFIYVILSVFISVIMDTYETIKKYYKEGFPKSDLQTFIEECTDDAHTLFRSYSTDKLRRRQDRLNRDDEEPKPGCGALCGCIPLPAGLLSCSSPNCNCCNRMTVAFDDLSDDEPREGLIT